MRYAVFADIHGNLEALNAALVETQKRKLNHYICLGDTIGYGANPKECFDWTLDNTELHVLGNHEAAIKTSLIKDTLVEWARDSIDWAAKRLSTELVGRIKELPIIQTAGNLTIAHGTIHSPERFEYLSNNAEASKSFMAMETQVGFVGHTHVPFIYSQKDSQNSGYLRKGVYKLKKDDRYLINPGSIGQPRDRDNRLSFGIFDDEALTFELVRIPYENRKAAEKIWAAGLPRMLGDRLL